MVLDDINMSTQEPDEKFTNLETAKDTGQSVPEAPPPAYSEISQYDPSPTQPKPKDSPLPYQENSNSPVVTKPAPLKRTLSQTVCSQPWRYNYQTPARTTTTTPATATHGDCCDLCDVCDSDFIGNLGVLCCCCIICFSDTSDFD